MNSSDENKFLERALMFAFSIACILFILIRYVSVIVLILSRLWLSIVVDRRIYHSITGTYGFFATSFTAESCRRFFLSTPIAKGSQHVCVTKIRHQTLHQQYFRLWCLRRFWGWGECAIMHTSLAHSWPPVTERSTFLVGEHGWNGLSSFRLSPPLLLSGSRTSISEIVSLNEFCSYSHTSLIFLSSHRGCKSEPFFVVEQCIDCWPHASSGKLHTWKQCYTWKHRCTFVCMAVLCGIHALRHHHPCHLNYILDKSRHQK